MKPSAEKSEAQSKTNTSLREQSTVSHIQSQEQIVPLAAAVNHNSEVGDGGSAVAHPEGMNLEVDSNTDLPQEYFLFIQQENQSMKEEIEEITASFRSDAIEHR